MIKKVTTFILIAFLVAITTIPALANPPEWGDEPEMTIKPIITTMLFHK